MEQYDGVSYSLASLRRSPGQQRIKDGRVAGSAARGDKCGRSSVVELLLPKQVVVGSSPIARSKLGLQSHFQGWRPFHFQGLLLLPLLLPFAKV